MSAKTRHQWLKDATEPDRQATFDRQKVVMEMFSDNAKTYIQLGGAALALTLTFAEKILHIPPEKSIVNFWTISIWSCFLLTIIAGAFYQYLAVKQLDAFLEWEYVTYWDWLPPGVVYAVTLLAFYGGVIIFTIYAIQGFNYVPSAR
jgi:hypothetical protein